MEGTHPLLAAAGLISGIVGGLIAAWTTWRKDQREHDQAPITIQDALLTQSGAAMNRMTERNRVTDERNALLDTEVDRLRGDRDRLRDTVYDLTDRLRAWTDFGTWLTSRWNAIRKSTIPPPLPHANTTTEGKR